jgi:hypothetical protein
MLKDVYIAELERIQNDPVSLFRAAGVPITTIKQVSRWEGAACDNCLLAGQLAVKCYADDDFPRPTPDEQWCEDWTNNGQWKDPEGDDE